MNKCILKTNLSMFFVRKSMKHENEYKKVSIKANKCVNSQFNDRNDNSWDGQSEFSGLFQIKNNNKG